MGGGGSCVTNNGLGFRNVTDNTLPMIIDDSGKVGIGTNDPQDMLHLDSGSSVVCGLSIENDAQIWRIKTDGNQSDNLVFRDATGTTGDRMVITTDGNVGIGTTAPGAPLVVVGTGDNARIGSASDGVVIAHGSGFGYIQWTDIGGSAYNELRFRTSGNYALTIDTSDRVGIGPLSSHGGSGGVDSLLHIHTPANGTTLGALADCGINLYNSTGVNAVSQVGFGYSRGRTNTASFIAYLRRLK